MLDGVKDAFESYIAYVDPTMWFLWKTLRVQGLNKRVLGPKYYNSNGQVCSSMQGATLWGAGRTHQEWQPDNQTVKLLWVQLGIPGLAAFEI